MSRKTRQKGKPKETIDWRGVPDSILLCNAPRWSSLPSPASLHPDAALMDRVVKDDPVARAIVDAWAFRFPVTVEVLNA